MTTKPILAYANRALPSDRVNVAYATVFPSMTILKLGYAPLSPGSEPRQPEGWTPTKMAAATRLEFTLQRVRDPKGNHVHSPILKIICVQVTIGLLGGTSLH